MRDDYLRHTHRELVALLGVGHAMIRTGPATFAPIDEISLDLAV